MTDSPTQPLADRLLLYLRRQTDVVPVPSLLKRFHIDNDTLNSALKEITGWGYRVKKMRGIVKYVKAPDFLTSTEIQFGLKSKRMGQAAHCYKSVKSTNDLAAQWPSKGLPKGPSSLPSNKRRGEVGWAGPGTRPSVQASISRLSFAPISLPTKLPAFR